ncbi:MAG: CDP-alcohol phosphatidyltransferase family protein [Pirellulales bacterium]
MLKSIGTTVYKNLANVVSILGVLPIALLFLEDGYQYLVPLIIYNNIMDDLDGILAGKLNIRSPFGANLDNVCDLVVHTVFVMIVGMQMWTETGDIWAGVCLLLSLVAATSLVLRVVSRLMPDAVPGTGTATNELMRHILFVLLLVPMFDISPIPLLLVVFVLHSISMLVPYRMPWLLRSLTKSATAIGLLNVILVVAWLVPYATLPIAAAFMLSYLFSFVCGGVEWVRETRVNVTS